MNTGKTTIQSQQLFSDIEFREVDKQLNVVIVGVGEFQMPLYQFGKSIKWGDPIKQQDSSKFYINGYGPFQLAGIEGTKKTIYFKGSDYQMSFDGKDAKLTSLSELKVMKESIQVFKYENSYEAKMIWYILPKKQKIEIAQAYVSAFEGPPWYEVGWYDVGNLVEKDLPNILSKLCPGIMVLKFSGNEIVGACMGGTTTLEGLIENKYKNNRVIKEEIAYNSNLLPSAQVFYDNENFINQDSQGKGIGSALNYEYFRALSESNIEQFLWRTINIPWGNIKTKQALELGYNVTRFQVSDDFKVNDVSTPRYVYFCKKAVDGQKAMFIDMCEA